MADSRTYGFEGTTPEIHESARVSQEATLVGEVTVGADASVWPGAVLRGDVGPVAVGEQSHVGDNAVLHAVDLGDQVMVGHGAICNDATVGDGTLVGFNATVSTDVTIGAGSILAAGTVLPDGYEVPPESFVRGVPATVTPLAETGIDARETFAEYSSGAYSDLVDRHDDLFR